jgi:ribose 5-phosphate isomerase A
MQSEELSQSDIISAMTQDELKALVGQAALEYVVPGSIVGVGTGSTVNCFIDALAAIKSTIRGAVSSSVKSTERLKAHGIEVFDSNEVESIPVYIDGADEIDHRGFMIKGGGAALTREKIVADLADTFVCIADESKLVHALGKFPLPVEVIPMAAAQIARRFQKTYGAAATVREGVITDNGNVILDVRGLQIEDPAAMETLVNQWPGVVTIGIFGRNKAGICLLGTAAGVRKLAF